MIAGFELPTAGRILLHGRDVTARAAVRPRRQHGLPGLRAVPAHDGRRERRVRPAWYARSPSATSGTRRVTDALRMVRLEGYDERKPGPAVRRPAPARRAGAGARQPPARAAARRAARRARPEAPRGDADRAQGDPAAGRHHVHLRHPRPGGGAHDERPAGGLQRRPDRAARARPPRSTSDPRRASSPASWARPTCSPATSPETVLGRTRHVHHPTGEDPPGRAGGGRRATTSRSALGRIRAVVYLGPDTRYIVTLDAGARSWSTQQNLATTSTEALAQEGKAVRLIWKRQHELSVADGGAIEEEEEETGMRHRRFLALAAVGGPGHRRV